MNAVDRRPGGLHVVRGVVEPGDQRGRLLGFPTANVALPDGGPPDGVWAACVLLPGTSRGPYVSAVSVGRRPTFYGADGPRLLEAYLLDVSIDLYGQVVEVTLHRYLRGQVACRDLAELEALLADDVARVRLWAAQDGEPPAISA